MIVLEINLAGGKTGYLPGEAICGTVAWALDHPEPGIELRLFWYTQGKGSQDIILIEKKRFDQPALQAQQPFQFMAPQEPISFSGQLVSVVWALELVLDAGRGSTRSVITISPTGKEIVLG